MSRSPAALAALVMALGCTSGADQNASKASSAGSGAAAQGGGAGGAPTQGANAGAGGTAGSGGDAGEHGGTAGISDNVGDTVDDSVGDDVPVEPDPAIEDDGEPETSEDDLVEPDADVSAADSDAGAEPDAPEPEVTEPDALQPEVTEPDVLEPEVLEPVPDYNDLREAAAEAGKLIGVAVRQGALENDAAYREILAREFDYVTPEDSAKWGSLQPTSGGYDWGPTDALVDFASSNDQAVKGHALIWHSQMPSWIDESMTAEQLRNAMRSHIETTLDHYRGQMRAWDVVNEAVDTATASGYRESIFFEKLGPEFIADAFRWAREADPDMLLLYNDYGIERIGPKSDFTYEMLSSLLDQGVPIDGIGFQSHISVHRYPSELDLQDNLQRFADLGLIVNISEVDALTTLMPGDQAARWHVQRVAFQQIVSACVAVDGCEAITFWGFSDNYSWLNDNSEQDPLLFDRNHQKKPAYEGVVHGLAGRRARYGENALRNGDFGDGVDQWTASGGRLAVTAAAGRDGNEACLADRESDADAIVQEGLADVLKVGTPYSFAAMIRADAAATVEASLLLQEPGAEDVERNFATIDVAEGTWTRLIGDFGFGLDTSPTVSLVLHGPDAGVELCVTEVTLRPVTVPE